MNNTPTQAASAGWDFMLEVGMVTVPEDTAGKRRLGLRSLSQHAHQMLGLATGTSHSGRNNYKVMEKAQSAGFRRWVEITPQLEADELSICAAVVSQQLPYSSVDEAKTEVRVHLTWCPLREAWVGRLLERNDEPIRDPQDPNGPLVRRSPEEEVAVALAEAWRWAAKRAK